MVKKGLREVEKYWGVVLMAAVLFVTNAGGEENRIVSVLTEHVKTSNDSQVGDWRVVIDPGHGGDDPGKIAVNGALEKDINLKIALLMEKFLQQNDVSVVVTRRTGDDLAGTYDGDSRKVRDMKKRQEIINSSEADCAISIHQNSYTDSRVSGAQVFYYTQSAKGACLADMVQDSLIRRLDPENSRKSKGNTTYYLLKKTDIPIVIAETGFLSNPEEAELLLQDEYAARAAWAVAMGVLNYLNSMD